MIQKLTFSICLISMFMLSSAKAEDSAKSTKEVKVLISKVIDHPALNATADGIVDALEKAGYKRGKNLYLRVESAQADPNLARQIADKFISSEPDIVIGIGTLSAQSLAKYAAAGKTKLIFSSVTDPISAGLVQNLKEPGGNISGVSNFVPLEPQVKLFKQLVPSIRRLGILYNQGELNSVNIVSRLDKVCSSIGLKLVKQTVSKTADVAQSALKLAGQVDAIFISNDNTALSAFASVVKAANELQKPVFVSDTDALIQGAVAALGPNQYEVGEQTGRMVVRVLQGQKLASQPVEFPDESDMYINLPAANKVNVHVPKAVLETANKVMTE